jgi:hypothetical protein
MKIGTRRCATALLLGLALGVRPGAVEAQAPADLLGGWIIAGWEWPAAAPADAAVPQRGLFLFAESGQYSMMFVIGEPRPALPDNPTDADVAAAYGPFVANSGRYTVSGNTITYEAFVAKDPAYMARFAPIGGEGNEQTMTFEISDGTLTLHFGEGGPMGGATATLRRPGTGSGN